MPWALIVVLATAAPFVGVLCGILWSMPYPLTEAVAIFEDIASRPASLFLLPDTSYYRPLFYMTLSAIWHGAGSQDTALAAIRLLHIVPVVLLVVLLVWHLRPRTSLDAAAATVAVAVLLGSRGFRDNLEIPLSYTIVGMAAALAVWMLVTRPPSRWRGALIVVLTALAIGFKEQGLVIVPVVLAAWWMGAPGATRRVAGVLAAIAAVYVVVRLTLSAHPLFEQSVGLGFAEMEPDEAVARFGAFPYFVYAYSSAATIGNVLFSEPTRGVFSIVLHLAQGRPEVWEIIHLVSSAALTGIIAWWGVRAVGRAATDGWSPDARLFAATAVAVLACGVLSFNYSRDRLGGMAVVFYAIAAHHAVRAAAARTAAMPRLRATAAGAALVLLAAAWQTRAVATLEIARVFSGRNQMEWLVMLPERRVEFARRPVYLRIMHGMIDQGTAPAAPVPTRYPEAVRRTLGLP